jgi:predicted ATPase
MRIEQLTIENFKCFKREQTFDFGRLTILTGANSSGKSSVMQALLMILQSEQFPAELSTNGDYVNMGDFREISNGQNSKNTIGIGTIISDSYRDRFEIKTSWKENKEDLLPKLVEIKEAFNGVDITNRDIHQNDYYLPNKLSNRVNFISAFRQSPQRTYFQKNKADLKLGREGEGFLEQIVDWEKRGNGKIKQFVKVMQDFDLIDNIKTKRLSGGRFEIYVKPINSSVFSDLSHVGSAVSQFLPVIVADLQLPDDSTLFLAEPEIHLHPSVQSKLGQYFVKQVNETEKNYVIETHSEYLLNRIRLAIVKGELKKEDFKIYFLENNSEDTVVHDIDFKKNGAIKNAPDNFFRTYFLDTMDIALNSFAE